MALQTSAQNNKAIYQAYLQGDMNKWKQTMNAFDPKTPAQVLELINYQYGYIAYCIGKNKKSEAEKYLSEAEKNISSLVKQKYQISTLYAYQAAFVGFKIGLAPFKAPFIGQQSISIIEKALQTDKNNHLAYIQLANVERYKPAIFGGSKTKAMEYYLKALYLMEAKPECLVNNWNYLNLLVSIIELYSGECQYNSAADYCQKALSVAPDFAWVKNGLFPSIKKHLNDE
jgi:hypothetical protein